MSGEAERATGETQKEKKPKYSQGILKLEENFVL